MKYNEIIPITVKTGCGKILNLDLGPANTGIIIEGRTGSGKTELTKSILDSIVCDKKIMETLNIIIYSNKLEYESTHPNVEARELVVLSYCNSHNMELADTLVKNYKLRDAGYLRALNRCGKLINKYSNPGNPTLLVYDTLGDNSLEHGLDWMIEHASNLGIYFIVIKYINPPKVTKRSYEHLGKLTRITTLHPNIGETDFTISVHKGLSLRGKPSKGRGTNIGLTGTKKYKAPKLVNR